MRKIVTGDQVAQLRNPDPLRRHLRSVAVRRLASLYKAFSWTNCLGTSP